MTGLKDFQESYQVTYSNLLNLLSDRDIQVIVSMLKNSKADNTSLANKLVEVTGYPYNKKSANGVDEYLLTLVNDYNYLASMGA